jgi:predicted acylesterase/phospholipase RssA
MTTTEASVDPGSTTLCRILSLDGGGAKGFYTLGVLKELEAMVGAPLHSIFDLIFGTSTGSIIAALLALGHSVDAIHALYKEHVPSVMRKRRPRDRSESLGRLVTTVFGEHTFTDTKTNVGIVATRWDFERPMIFKSDIAQAHGRRSTFLPGFGCTIGDAVRASCSAYPFYERTTLTTGRGEVVELIDGGYCANNPTLYAIADAVQALGRSRSSLRVVSLGVGGYPEPKRSWIERKKRSLYIVQLLQKTLDINTTSMEQLRAILFKDVDTVRINDTFEKPEMATDLMESDLTKLGLLFQRGSESFAKYESDLKRVLSLTPVA